MARDHKIKVTNFSEFYYYPPKRLREGLEEVIIFPVGTKRSVIPNGSVFVYKRDTPYNPEILKENVGCGITAFATEKFITEESETLDDVLKAVDDLGIHIGEGNHFIDFTTGYPSLLDSRLIEKTNMIYLHTHFNLERKVPDNYKQAKEMERIAREKRIEYLEKLIGLLGIRGTFYEDWIHNSVSIEGDKLIYRKGAINLKSSKHHGLLARNPVDGVYLYGGIFDEFFHSLPYATGQKQSKGKALKLLPQKSKGIAKGYLIPDNEDVCNKVIECFCSHDLFFNHFATYQWPLGVCLPYFIVITKKTGSIK